LTSVGLTWADGLSDGGAPIFDYRVKSRILGDVEYSVVATDILTQDYTVSDLVLGTTYEFIVEARN